MQDEKDGAGLTRRNFLRVGGAAAAVIGAALPGLAAEGGEDDKAPMPMRTLGKTGRTVSLLGFGGGSQFLTATEDESSALLEYAIAQGITYFDTAASYGPDRKSEKRYGVVLPKYRDRIYLATKSDDRTYDGIMRSVETSLKLLKTDYLDAIQMHDVGPRDTIDAWAKPEGALTAIRKLKDQKVVRFIGFTGHQNANVHKAVIERYDYDTVLMATNAAANKAFPQVALPAAVKKNMGIISMKTTRNLVGTGPGKATPRELLAYVWDLPICVSIIGHTNKTMLDDNIALARSYKPGAVDTKALVARLAPHVTDEQLGWAMEEYRDRVMV